MKVLVIGSGGRECALAWRIALDENIKKVLVAPGNPGMSSMSSKIELRECSDQLSYLKCAQDEKVELVIVGPENHLVDGIADLFNQNKIPLVGPTKACALLEGSKIFSKEFMREANIPTARFEVKSSYESACDLIDHWPFSDKGHVIKADGLAGGKGVVVASDKKEAKKALYDFMLDEKISVKTKSVLIEEVLQGVELSFFALCDGESFTYLGSARDHKRLLDGDMGPNTGGMGCVGSAHLISDSLKDKIETRILKPTLESFTKKGTPYRGFLFIGLMIDENEDPFVIEYNVRMGDPETQTLLPLLEGNFSLELLACAHGELGRFSSSVSLKDIDSVHVVATSKGYPDLALEGMLKNQLITGLDLKPHHDLMTFCAGVKVINGELINSGGRVLGVTALGNSISEARDRAYRKIEKLSFKGMFYRKDIGAGL